MDDDIIDLTVDTIQEITNATESNLKSSWGTDWVGKLCEIYWSPSISTTSTSTSESQGNAKKRTNNKRKRNKVDDFEADWYDGTILSFQPPTNPNDDMGIFHVTFLGENKMYTMKLKQTSIRPSARAWIQDTIKILLDVPEFLQNTLKPFDRWNKNIQQQLRTLHNLPVSKSNQNDSLEDDEDSSVDEWDSKRSCTNKRDGCGQGKDDGNSIPKTVYLDEQLEEEMDLFEHGFPLNKVPPPEYIYQLEHNLKLASQVCNWWNKEIDCFEDKKMDFSDLKIILGRCIHYILNLVMMPILFLSTHTSKESYNSYNTLVLQPWLQLMNDTNKTNSTTDFKLFIQTGTPQLLDELTVLSKTYPYRQCIPYMASKVMFLYAEYWHSASTWIEDSNRMLGYVLRPDHCIDQGYKQRHEQDLLSMKISFNLEDIQCHLDVSKMGLCFRCIQVDSYQMALHEKMQCVKNIALRLWRLIDQCIDDPIEILSIECLRSTALSSHVGDDDRPWQFVEDVDPILRELCYIKAQWTSDPRLSNMSVIAANNDTYQSDTLSLQKLEQVIFVRRWIIEMKIVESRRERHCLVTSVISRGSCIPHLPSRPMSLLSSDSNVSHRPSTAEYISQMLGRLATLSSQVYSSGIIAATYARLLEESRCDSLPSGGSQESNALRSIAGIRQALDILQKSPIIYPVEEYLYIRLQILAFRDYIEPKLSMPGMRFSFQEISHMYRCSTALRLQKPIEFPTENIPITRQFSLFYDDTAEGNLKQISNLEMNLFCTDITKSLKHIFEQAVSWKSEADIPISHFKKSRVASNNITVSNVSQPNTMIRLSQIDKLLQQYEGSRFLFEEEYDFLRRERDETLTWVDEINDLVCKYNGDPTHLSLLELKNTQRPSCICTEPSSETVVLWVQFMRWHQRVLELDLDTSLSNSAQFSDTAYWSYLTNHIEPLLWEGYEILTDATVVDNMSLFYREVPKHLCAVVPEKLKGLGNIQLLSVSEMKSTKTGTYLLKSLSMMDESTVSKLFILQLVLWHRAAMKFNFKSTQNSGTQRFLSDARDLIDSISSPSNSWNIHILASTFEIATFVKETCYKTLKKLVESSDYVEKDTEEALTECTLIGGDLYTNKKIFIDMHLKLYDLTTKASSPSILKISPTIEQQLAKRHQEFRWLDLCRQYPILFKNKDDVDVLGAVEAETESVEDLKDGDRIPILTLHQLCSSIVNGNRENDNKTNINSCLDKEINRLEVLVRKLVGAATIWKNDVIAKCSKSVSVELCYLESLYNHEVLTKVSLPQDEDMLYSIIDVASRIKFSLNRFFTHSNVNDDTTVFIQAPPKSFSVVGRFGEFTLFQFYNSSFYSQIKEYLRSCVFLCQKIDVITGEKRVLEWFSDLWLWLDNVCGKFHHSMSKLTIGHDDCKDLIGSLSRLLFITDGVITTLDYYSIATTVKHPSGKMFVNVSHSVVSCSVGCHALRWLVFFYNALQADLKATDTWSASIEKLSASFHSNALPQKRKEYVAKIRELWGDLRKKLVVLPSTATFNCANAILSLEEPTAIDSCLGNNADFIDDRFEDDEKIVSDRFVVLDNLINRKAEARSGKIVEKCWDHLYETSNIPDASQLLPNELVRLKSRSFFESSFIKAIENIGIENCSELWYESLSICSILAWELETIVYDKMVGEGNEDYERLVNEEYKAKVLSLRFNLEDKKNPSLCARVLLGILSLSSLVDMAPEQLASKDLQDTRARVEEESKKNHIMPSLVNSNKSSHQLSDEKPSTSTLPIDYGLKVETKERSSSTHTLESIPDNILNKDETSRMFLSTSLSFPFETLKDNEAEGKRHFQTKASTYIPAEGKMNISVAQTIEQPSASISFKQENTIDSSLFIIDSSSDDKGITALRLEDNEEEEEDGEEMGANNKLLPSLLGNNRSGNLVMSLSGTRDYLFSIKAMKLSFSAGLFWDRSSSVPFHSISNLLPHEIVDKGRVPIDEFNNFIHAKMKSSNKWEMVPLRLVNIHDEDEKHFKTFYKEYESIRRIAMFRIDDNIHLFLVTPKFLDVAQCLDELIANKKKSSTYAVVLLKRSI